MPHNAPIRLHPSTHLTEPLRRLYLDAFPAEERRPLHLLSMMIESPTTALALFVVERLDAPASPAGFLTLWMLPGGVRYIEHFATLPELRGQGIGSRALELIPDDAPLVIEVELPRDDVSRRRIDFYRRAGFTLHDDFVYIQPPYSAALDSVEMRLMTRGDLSGRSIEDIADELRRTVYGA